MTFPAVTWTFLGGSHVWAETLVDSLKSDAQQAIGMVVSILEPIVCDRPVWRGVTLAIECTRKLGAFTVRSPRSPGVVPGTLRISVTKPE